MTDMTNSVLFINLKNENYIYKLADDWNFFVEYYELIGLLMINYSEWVYFFI